MIDMLEMICSIPENVGWIIVGAAGMLAMVMLVKLGKLFVQMWKDNHAEEKEFC